MKIKLNFLLIIIMLASCNGNREHAERSDDSMIHRYEVALFSLDMEDFESGLRKIAPEYRIFLGDNYLEPQALVQLKDFVTDQQNQEVYDEVIKQFPQLDWLSSALSEGYARSSHALESFVIPHTYTYISGFDFQYPIKYADSAMIIALDMYLGQDYEMYKKLGIPLYISQRLTREHILPDCMKEIALTKIPEKQGTYSLLEAMIEQGKVLYFTDVALPDVADRLKIGFSENQLRWCRDNESNLWQFMVENELLYSSDAKAMSMFMVDGPFTSSFSQDSPARTGAWMGWKIVRTYMKNNNVTIQQLLDNINAREILEKSGYKPPRK
ncbi:MAG: hypothetical protein PHT26_07940 [Lentimicrobiaceae bacterium]|nr:hypothetical protein [Lentimicrobiaceae bacterium]